MSYTEMNFGGGGVSSADKVIYNNATSGLEADNVQDAIDEVNSNLENISSNLKAIRRTDIVFTPNTALVGPASWVKVFQLGNLFLIVMQIYPVVTMDGNWTHEIGTITNMPDIFFEFIMPQAQSKTCAVKHEIGSDKLLMRNVSQTSQWASGFICDVLTD